MTHTQTVAWQIIIQFRDINFIFLTHYHAEFQQDAFKYYYFPSEY
jgi:ribonuclease BN (tRNA processing enzyme)